MTAPRFFLTEELRGIAGAPAGGEADVEQLVEVPLSVADLHHVADALRLKPGESITAASPSGAVWHLEAVEISRDRLVARVARCERPAPLPFVTLVQGVAKGPKMDRIVEQAVEIGVSRILPALTERTVVKLDAEKRAERGARWRRVAEAAAKQSRRTSIPEVADPATLEELGPVLADCDVLLVVWEDAGDGTTPAHGIADELRHAGATAQSAVALVIGPEGGLDAAEVEWLRTLGGRPCSLGSTIMRTETAGLVALTLALWALGGLGAQAD